MLKIWAIYFLAIVAFGVIADHPPAITLHGHGTVVLPVLKGQASAHHHHHYTDAGAQCSDAIDGLIGAQGETHVNPFPQLTVGGEVVNRKRVGVYRMRYDCFNSRGLWAKPVERKIVVTGHFLHQCMQVRISGLPPTNPQAHRMGIYKQKSYYHGRPEYRQLNGRSYLYFRSNFDGLAHSWVVDGYAQKDIRGLRIGSMSEQPDKLAGGDAHPWSFFAGNNSQMADASSKAWVANAQIHVECLSKVNHLDWYPHFKGGDGKKGERKGERAKKGEGKGKGGVHKPNTNTATKTKQHGGSGDGDGSGSEMPILFPDEALHAAMKQAIAGMKAANTKATGGSKHSKLLAPCRNHFKVGEWSKGCTLSCGAGAQRLREKVVVTCSKVTNHQPKVLILKQRKVCHIRRCRAGELPKAVRVVVPEVATEYLRR
jgi:hypothetical protein